MATTFCTRCGHPNEAGAGFCENCGQPLAGADTASARPPQARRRLWLYGGAALALLLGAALALFFALRGQPPSPELFAAIIEKSLAQDPAAYQKNYCLSNFNYALDPVRISAADERARRWFSLLADQGLYAQGQLETTGSGFFASEQLLYEKTAAGKKASAGSALCLADGVGVARVDSFSSPARVLGVELSKAVVTLQLRNPLALVDKEEIKQFAPNIRREFVDMKTLVRSEGKWQLAGPAEIRALQAALEKTGDAAPPGGAISRFFSSLFKKGAGANPLYGRWNANVFGSLVFSVEFDSDSMNVHGEQVKPTRVRYEIDGDKVRVFPEGSSVGLVFHIVDSDTVNVNMLGRQLQLKRAK